MMNPLSFLLSVALQIVAARFTRCDDSDLAVSLYADPVDHLSGDQFIHLRVHYTITPDMWIPDGSIHVSTWLNTILVKSWWEPLRNRVAGTYEYSLTAPYPAMFGAVRTTIEARNSSGGPLFCGTWTAFAAG